MTQQPLLPTGLTGQLRQLFDRQDALQATGLLCLMIIGATLEMIAVSMMFPLIEALANPSGKPTMPLAVMIYRLSGNVDHTHFVFFLLTFLVFFYVIKNLFFSLLFYLQNRFGFHKQGKLSYRLFAHYLSLPYTFHLERNSGDLLRNLTHETDQIVWSILLPGLALITESLVAIGLVALLFYSSFEAALVISSIFGIAGFIYYWTFRNKLEEWGTGRMHHDAMRIRAIHEGLGALKELKVLARTAYFLGAYAKHNARRAEMTSRHNLVLGSNLLLLEVLGMSSLLILVGLHLAADKPFSTILPLMGVFAGAAFRLIPATNRIINNFQQIRYANAPIRNLCEELAQAKESLGAEHGTDDLQFMHEISIRDITYAYTPTTPPVLDGVSLTIRHSEMVGLMGVSGTGKTTLVDVLLGLLQPSTGGVYVDGKNINTHLAAWQRKIGYIPQGIYLIDGTIRQNVALGIQESDIDDRKVMEALREASLADFVASLRFGANTPVGELGKQLSGGQRQRIGIARALYHDPELLVLDEATSSLDAATEADVINAIKMMRGKKTMVIISHHRETLVHCDRIYRLENGIIQ